MKILLNAILLTGFLLFINPAGYAQPGTARFGHELYYNKALFLQGDSMHLPLSPTPARHDSMFSAAIPPLAWHGTVHDAVWKVHPVVEGYYEWAGSHAHIFSAAGISASYTKHSLSFWGTALAGYSRFSGISYARYDTLDLQPGYGRWQHQGKWLDALFRLKYKPLDFLWIEAGRNRLATGSGLRSLLLGENGPAYPYANLAIDFPAFHYDFRVMQLREYAQRSGQNQWIRKFAAMHQFHWNAAEWLHIYAFESIVWGARDSVGYRGWEWNYLNPVVFLRPVEFSIGSPDNVLMGLGLNIRPWRRLLLYGQFVLDEFNLSYARMEESWWANKYGLQAGLRWINPFSVPASWLQTEVNVVRPFTYSHTNRYVAYSHQMSSLAHPAGANFAEWLLQAGTQRGNWQWRVEAAAMLKGRDTRDTVSYGGDILKSYLQRNQDFGISLWNGAQMARARANMHAAYLLDPESGISFYVKAGMEYTEDGATAVIQPFLRLAIQSRLRHPQTNYVY